MRISAESAASQPAVPSASLWRPMEAMKRKAGEKGSPQMAQIFAED